jgi:hypothetical protein
VVRWTKVEQDLSVEQVADLLADIEEGLCDLAIRQADLDAQKADLDRRKLRLLRLQRILEQRYG